MHLSYIITTAAFASLIHSQASNVSESDPAASATSPLSTDSTDSGESIPNGKTLCHHNLSSPSTGEQHMHDHRNQR